MNIRFNSQLDFNETNGSEHTEHSPAAYTSVREDTSTGANDSSPLKSQLRTKSILITGASSGIGKALALEYAKDPNTILFLTGRNLQRLTETKKACEKLGAKVHIQAIDTNDQQKMQNWIEHCNQKHELNLVIANAGISCGEEVPDNIYCTFQTNIFGTLNTITPTLEIFKKRSNLTLAPCGRGRVAANLFASCNSGEGSNTAPQSDTHNFSQPQLEIFKNKSSNCPSPFKGRLGGVSQTSIHMQIAIISSLAGYHGLPSAPSYSASKACVKAYGEALRARHTKDGIKINVICPGFVRSNITDQNKFTMPFFMEAEKAAKIIKKRLEKNVGLIAFPWPMRLAAYLLAILPNRLSNFIYAKLPSKS